MSPHARARHWLERIHALPPGPPIRVMNVCGGHERTITMAGLRGVLPSWVELIPGPGCPVCVCPEEDIFDAIQLALAGEGILVTAFGDLLRVPVNLPPSRPRSLERARAAGGAIQPVASPLEVVALAERHPNRPVVFLAAGFETTMAPVAAMMAQGVPENLLLLLSGRLTWPAVALLLESGDPGFDALIAPGHVSTIGGPGEWAFVAETHHLPVAVAGFTPEGLLAGLWSVLRQVREGRVFLDNCYPEVVHPDGNPAARRLLAQVFEVVDAPWRGLGVIPNSGYRLREHLRHHDARHRFALLLAAGEGRPRMGEMPPGCDCARVILGRIPPTACRLYGHPCTPRAPVGPCMVSDEGACRIWWAAGRRAGVASPGEAPGSGG